jgi:hypothetical protein
MKKFWLLMLFSNFIFSSTYASEDKDVYLNIYCSESLRRPVPSPHIYFIRHTSDNVAKLLFWVGGQPHDEAYVIPNLGLTITNGKFFYDKSEIQKLLNHDTLAKSDVWTSSIDRMSGELSVMRTTNIGQGQLIRSDINFKCIAAKDSQFDEWEKAISSAKAKKAQDQIIEDKNKNEKIINERKF